RRILRLGLPTVIDEAYYELSEQRSSFAYLLREFPNAIVLRTFSKAFGLAGMRLGYAFGHASVVRLLARVKVPWNIPEITLAAASAALDDVAEFSARLAELKAGREALSRRVGRVPGLNVVPSEGNFVLIDISQTGVSAQQFVDGMLEEGVLIRSLAVHHAARAYVRITVGTLDQNSICAGAMERVAARFSSRETPAPSSPYAAASAGAE
ncbi:MAG TPA: aminotransferase class I/II-fold pyridoxal phosphate-dependent enzyme, partial [Polyangiales bacterium]|nr:aminotransferase class I/II-fold pyridoxal phosphate-dependent enzyme [Polyangiales bacterium]